MIGLLISFFVTLGILIAILWDHHPPKHIPPVPAPSMAPMPPAEPPKGNS